MKVPLSWLKDYVDINLSTVELARVLTQIGLEVDEIHLIGLPAPEGENREFKITGLSWDPDKIVVAEISEVMPHPNADRLTLCRLNDGSPEEQIVLTGAPNLYPYKGQGVLPKTLKVAYAREGARIYDGHAEGLVLTTLKRAKIRGVDSYSMVCSEKELGISDEHEGILFLEDDAVPGTPLSEVLGDAVYEISILPNMIRNASVLGVAREVAAATGQALHYPPVQVEMKGAPIAGQASIEIRNPDLNPRFMLGLVRNVQIGPSPLKVQNRLRLTGMRPINNVVDVTNYVMLELGQPLHAFDYDMLVQRAGGVAPTIITRTAEPGEKLTTLDGVERALDPFTVLVCDTAGALSIAGVMGGSETEVTSSTRNVLIESAAWNFINIRKTVSAQKLNSEAGYRNSRGVHPALAETGVKLCLERLRLWANGEVAQGVVDDYPQPVTDPAVLIRPSDVKRLLNIDLSSQEIAALLCRLEFRCTVEADGVLAHVPPHRLDIGEGVIGKADLLEEIARMYGYDNIPETHPSEPLPPMHRNLLVEGEERIRDILTSLGMQEVMTYRLTSPERENRLLPKGTSDPQAEYVRIQNPIAPERSVMRRSLLASVMEVLERNTRLSSHLALFEIGPVFLPHEGQQLPDEPHRLALALSGQRYPTSWDTPNPPRIDFYDMKGLLESLVDALHIPEVRVERAEHPSMHPGKCARILAGEREMGVFGEIHPLVRENYDLSEGPVLLADLDLGALLASAPELYETHLVVVYPTIKEDIAVVVDEEVAAGQVEALIRQTGGKLLIDVALFDIFRGEQIGAGKKSLAYNLTYQASDRTLTDKEVAAVRGKIVRRLEHEVGAKLRS
jgi:phenylalanyl-tRNA synthetase beta chain